MVAMLTGCGLRRADPRALTLVQLYAVAFVASALTVLFNVAQISILPALVSREDLLEAKLAFGLRPCPAGDSRTSPSSASLRPSVRPGSWPDV